MCKTKRVFTIESKNLKKLYEANNKGTKISENQIRSDLRCERLRVWFLFNFNFRSHNFTFEAITLQVERSSSKIFRTVFTSLPCVTIFSVTSPYICQIWLLKQILHYFKISHLYLTRTCEVKSFFLYFLDKYMRRNLPSRHYNTCAPYKMKLLQIEGKILTESFYNSSSL